MPENVSPARIRSALVIITGAPGAGKTTLARKLAREFNLPLIAKDDIKETLFDTLGWQDRAWSQKLGGATYELIYYFAATLASTGQSLIVESNFSATATPRFQALQAKYNLAILQIRLKCGGAILRERFKTRWATGARHRGHVDGTPSDAELAAMLARNDAPLDLNGTLLEVDTTDFAAVDYIALCAAVRRVLEKD